MPIEDISAIKASEARFEFLAQHDPLTGLPNRLLFATRAERALARARFYGGRVAVMSLDLELEITANEMGIRTPLRPYLSTALGASEVQLLELADACRAIGGAPGRGSFYPRHGPAPG